MKVELCHTTGQRDLVFYITVGAQTRDDVLAALISAQLKSAYIFGRLLHGKPRVSHK